MDCILFWIEKHPGLGAWVQALGAIGALGVAIWLSKRQNELVVLREEERSREEHLQFINAVLAIVVYAQRLLNRVPGPASEEDEVEVFFKVHLDYKPFEYSVDALKSIPLYRISSGDAIAAVMSLTATMPNALADLQNANHAYSNPQMADWRIAMQRFEGHIFTVNEVVSTIELLRDKYILK